MSGSSIRCCTRLDNRITCPSRPMQSSSVIHTGNAACMVLGVNNSHAGLMRYKHLEEAGTGEAQGGGCWID